MSYPQRLHTFTPRSFVLPDLIGLSEPILRLHEYTSGDATFVPGDTLNPSYAAAASASREWTLSHDTSTITVARPGAPGGSRRVRADANGLVTIIDGKILIPKALVVVAVETAANLDTGNAGGGRVVLVLPGSDAGAALQ